MVDTVAATKKRIAVIGDSMTDVYLRGTFSYCQDECLKFVAQSRVVCPGGAANAAESIKHWGADVERFGNTLENGPTKIRFLAGDSIKFRYDMDIMDMDDRHRKVEFRALCDWNPDAILISDYDKGFLTSELIARIIKWARHIPCVADAKREPLVYSGAIIKGNAAWFAQHRDVMQHCRKAVMTNGPELPVVSYWDSQKVCGQSLVQVNCVNHVGAGDCFAAHLTLALASGLSIDDAATFAHTASRVYVQYPNNRAPYPKELV